MPSLWADLHAGLEHAITTSRAARRFAAIRARHGPLDRFTSPTDLVAFLHNMGTPPGEKDNVIRALVLESQEGPPRSDLALNLLLLGLWPGLEGVRYRRRQGDGDRSDDLGHAVVDCFITVVLRADMTRINRVAGTLVQNTYRTR